MFCLLLVMLFSHKEKLYLVAQEVAVPPVPPSFALLPFHLSNNSNQMACWENLVLV